MNNICSKILSNCQFILPEHLSHADLVEEVSMGTGNAVKVSVTRSAYSVVNCVGCGRECR